MRRPTLTPTENEVLALILQGKTNQEIAEQRFVALSTIKSQVRGLLSKFGADRREDLISKAYHCGFASVPLTEDMYQKFVFELERRGLTVADANAILTQTGLSIPNG